MPEYVEVARADTPRGELVLRARQATDDAPAALELRVNGIFVMDTVETATERALATRALQLVAAPRAVLVGGLGLGFTMAAVLADPRVEECTVVELEDVLVGWLRDGTVPHGPPMLADERLRVVVADVRVALREARAASYDLVLLDVDNGPDHLVHDLNRELYDAPTLRTAREALRPGGVLVIWSADESPTLHRTLTEVFGAAEAIALDVRLQDRDEAYWLHVARSPDPGLDRPGHGV